MDWAHDRPIRGSRFRKIHDYLRKKFGKAAPAERIVKTIALGEFLRAHNWKSPAHIRASVFHDSEKTRPMFTEAQSRSAFRALAHKGGTSDEAVLLDRGVRALIAYLRDYMPNVVVNLGDVAYPYITFLKTLQEIPEIGPIIDIAKEAAVQAGTTGIIAADTIGAEMGGPVGVAVVAIPVAIAGMMIVITHVLEDELGEAVLASLLVLPFVGPVLYKLAISSAKLGNKVEQEFPGIFPFGGKRFSTRRRSSPKWRKRTQRQRSARR
jgi:hypothetical protein